MFIDKYYPEIKKVDGHYIYKRNIESDRSIDIELDSWLEVTGSIEAVECIKSSCSIEARGRIKAGGYIEAGGHIEAIGPIEADRYIEAGGHIEADGRIKAGEGIDARCYIKANRYIEAREGIDAGGYIKADEGIDSGGAINSGNYIEAGKCYGISAIFSITAKKYIKCGLNIFAGICTWKRTNDEDKTITCSELIDGKVAYGILNETGEPKRTIEIDGKTIEISEDSYQAFKKQFKEG